MIVAATDLAIPGRLEPTDLALAPGVTCLVGPNGSGKTSLLHALAGIGAPEGEVRIDGEDPRRAPPARRRRLVAFLPASREIAWPLTGRDVIALGGEAPEGELVEHLGLSGLLGRRVDRMSTGERSRILIARALGPRPRLLLLDEPAANLDPLWQLRLLDYLTRHAAADGQAVCMAMHDLGLAHDHADRLIIMDERRIAADGDPRGLIEGPVIPAVFGIEREGARWRPVSPPEDRRSSP